MVSSMTRCDIRGTQRPRPVWHFCSRAYRRRLGVQKGPRISPVYRYISESFAYLNYLTCTPRGVKPHTRGPGGRGGASRLRASSRRTSCRSLAESLSSAVRWTTHLFYPFCLCVACMCDLYSTEGYVQLHFIEYILHTLVTQ